MSNNKLKNEFATIALTLLKANISTFTLNLLGNPIGFCKIQQINIALEKNKNLIRQIKMPGYREEIKRLEGTLQNADKIVTAISKVKEEYQKEQEGTEELQSFFEKIQRMKAADRMTLQRNHYTLNKGLNKVSQVLNQFNKKYETEEQAKIELLKDIEDKNNAVLSQIELLTNACTPTLSLVVDRMRENAMAMREKKEKKKGELKKLLDSEKLK